MPNRPLGDGGGVFFFGPSTPARLVFDDDSPTRQLATHQGGVLLRFCGIEGDSVTILVVVRIRKRSLIDTYLIASNRYR